MTLGDWIEYAACRDYPAEWWDGSVKIKDTIKAKIICSVCPVRQECLEYAIRLQPSHCIWAGKTVEELKALSLGVIFQCQMCGKDVSRRFYKQTLCGSQECKEARKRLTAKKSGRYPRTWI